jgi:soluble epoxide hydrolase/lipid-phosphate phosphatase
MAFSADTRHATTRLPSGTSYCYIYLAPIDTKGHPQLPVILFLHGFPSSAFDWRHQLLYFSSRGYGSLAPDLLGYGGTDQPLDVHAYKMSKMAGEVVELLDHLKIDKVFGVGHDWGSTLLSNLLRLHAERFLAFAFLATYYTPSNPYMSSGHEFDYKTVSEATKKSYGFDAFGHTIFLADAERAGKILDEHLDSFFSIVYPKEVSSFRAHFRKEGGIEAWVIAEMTGDRPFWITEGVRTVLPSLVAEVCGMRCRI